MSGIILLIVDAVAFLCIPLAILLKLFHRLKSDSKTVQFSIVSLLLLSIFMSGFILLGLHVTKNTDVALLLSLSTYSCEWAFYGSGLLGMAIFLLIAEHYSFQDKSLGRDATLTVLFGILGMVAGCIWFFFVLGIHFLWFVAFEIRK